MATIQIRNVPEAVHRVYQMRAVAAGMSLQEYLLAELEHNAGLRSPAELIDEVETRMRVEGREGFAAASSVRRARSRGAAGRSLGKANDTATSSSSKRLARTVGRSGSGSNRRATGTAVGGAARRAR